MNFSKPVKISILRFSIIILLTTLNFGVISTRNLVYGEPEFDQTNQYFLLFTEEGIVEFNKAIEPSGYFFKHIPPKETSKDFPFDYQIYKNGNFVKEFDRSPYCATFNPADNSYWYLAEEGQPPNMVKNIYKNESLYKKLEFKQWAFGCPKFIGEKAYFLITNENFTTCYLYEDQKVIREFVCRSTHTPVLNVSDGEWILYREFNPVVSMVLPEPVYVRVE